MRDTCELGDTIVRNHRRMNGIKHTESLHAMTPLSLSVSRARLPFLPRFSRALQCCSILLIGVILTGCRSDVPETESTGVQEETAARAPSTVPLRIVSTATSEFNNQLQLVWDAYSEQPIEIIAADSGTLRSTARQADVVLFRNAEMGELQARDSLTPLPAPFLQAEAVDADAFLAGLVHGSMKWGDTVYALPLGTALPVVWIATDIDAPESLTWQEYRELIASLAEGESAEPLAEGWAASSFLHRAASLTGSAWLFDRNTLRPVIDGSPYVRALEQLVADRQRYPESLLTPEQVWRRLADGEIRVAIGWPASSDSGASPSGTLRMLPYPAGEEVFIDGWETAGSAPRPVALSPRGLLVAIAASCRQTSAARDFLAWIVSGEGQAAMRAAASDVGPNRAADFSEYGSSLPLASHSDPALETYDQYVMERLSEGYVRTSLRLPAATEYLEALDRGVLSALTGKVAPDAALATVAQEWESITERIGRKQQINQWRQAQGLRGR